MDVQRLKDPDHRDKLAWRFQDLYHNRVLTDVILFTSDGMELKAHWLILAAYSEIFKQLAISHKTMNNNCVGTVVKLEFSSDIVAILLNYCYKGELIITMTTKHDVKKAAQLLLMNDILKLLEACALDEPVGHTSSEGADPSLTASQTQPDGGQTDQVQQEVRDVSPVVRDDLETKKGIKTVGIWPESMKSTSSLLKQFSEIVTLQSEAGKLKPLSVAGKSEQVPEADKSKYISLDLSNLQRSKLRREIMKFENPVLKKQPTIPTRRAIYHKLVVPKERKSNDTWDPCLSIRTARNIGARMFQTRVLMHCCVTLDSLDTNDKLFLCRKCNKKFSRFSVWRLHYCTTHLPYLFKGISLDDLRINNRNRKVMTSTMKKKEVYFNWEVFSPMKVNEDSVLHETFPHREYDVDNNIHVTFQPGSSLAGATAVPVGSVTLYPQVSDQPLTTMPTSTPIQAQPLLSQQVAPPVSTPASPIISQQQFLASSLPHHQYTSSTLVLCPDQTAIPPPPPLHQTQMIPPAIASTSLPQAPVTPTLLTQAPLTQAPLTQAPLTQAPLTQAPLTQALLTQAPLTQAPLTQAPLNAPPMMSPIMTVPLPSQSVVPSLGVAHAPLPPVQTITMEQNLVPPQVQLHPVGPLVGPAVGPVAGPVGLVAGPAVGPVAVPVSGPAVGPPIDPPGVPPPVVQNPNTSVALTLSPPGTATIAVPAPPGASNALPGAPPVKPEQTSSQWLPSHDSWMSFLQSDSFTASVLGPPPPQAQNTQYITMIKCSVKGCSFAGYSTRAVNKHMHDTHLNLECSYCMFACSDKDELERHIADRHERKKSRQYACSICRKKFSKAIHHRTHEQTHHGIDHNMKEYCCDVAGCEFRTLAKHNYYKHQMTHQEKMFSCQYCGIKIRTMDYLQRHINKQHLNIRPFQCEHCGSAFGDMHALKSHISAVHVKKKEFKCEHCVYAANIRYKVATHMYQVHGIRASFDKRKEIKCPHCSYTALVKSWMTKHMDRHATTKNYTCDQCGKTFGSPRNLNSHTRWAHKTAKHQCPHCEYITKTPTRLKNHIKTQHMFRGYKPYTCPYCPFKCATGGNCRKHVMQRHPGQSVTYERNEELLAYMRSAGRTPEEEAYDAQVQT